MQRMSGEKTLHGHLRDGSLRRTSGPIGIHPLHTTSTTPMTGKITV